MKSSFTKDELGTTQRKQYHRLECEILQSIGEVFTADYPSRFDAEPKCPLRASRIASFPMNTTTSITRGKQERLAFVE